MNYFLILIVRISTTIHTLVEIEMRWKLYWLQRKLEDSDLKGYLREKVGWLHWLNGHEFEQAPGVGDGQGSLECCGSWGHKELDTTEWLNWTEERRVIDLSERLCLVLRF